MTLAEVLQKETRERIARNMLQSGLDYETIAFCTDLSVEEVQSLTKKAS